MHSCYLCCVLFVHFAFKFVLLSPISEGRSLTVHAKSEIRELWRICELNSIRIYLIHHISHQTVTNVMTSFKQEDMKNDKSLTYIGKHKPVYLGEMFMKSWTKFLGDDCLDLLDSMFPVKVIFLWCNCSLMDVNTLDLDILWLQVTYPPSMIYQVSNYEREKVEGGIAISTDTHRPLKQWHMILV